MPNESEHLPGCISFFTRHSPTPAIPSAVENTIPISPPPIDPVHERSVAIELRIKGLPPLYSRCPFKIEIRCFYATLG